MVIKATEKCMPGERDKENKTMKKELIYLLAAASLGTICIISPKADSAAPETNGDFSYTVSDTQNKTCTINKYLGEEKDVTVPETVNGYSVTEIGSRAFMNKFMIHKISLPETVTAIGEDAFFSCSSLEAINLPDSIEKIGHNAFYECDDLKSIKLPANLKTIGGGAFYECSFKELNIPQYVEKIGSGAFMAGSSFDSIRVDPANKNYDSRENCNALIETSTNTLLKASVNTLAVPAGVTAIGSHAFFCNSNLKEISIPSSVKTIGKEAFANCTNLEKVTMSEGLNTIENSAFYECSSLKDLKLPESLVKLKKESFRGCTNLNSIYIPAGLKKADLRSVFAECKALNSITVADGNAFFDSRSNCNAIIEKSTDTLIIGSNGSTVPSSVKKIDKEAFSDLTGLKEIVIPDTVREIGEGAFKNCTNLNKVTLPAKLKSIEAETFYCCSSLKTVKLPKSITVIKENAFSGCGLKSVKLPDSLVAVEANAFSCALEKLKIPKKLKNAVWSDVFLSSFNTASLKKLSVDPKNPYYDSRNNCNAVIEKSTGKLVMACGKTTIPSSLKEIGDFAFYNHSELKEVKIPAGVKAIGSDAFSECNNLKKITLPKSIKRIGRSPFASLNLKTINYKGSKADWNKIKFDDPGNAKNRCVKFNYKG